MSAPLSLAAYRLVTRTLGPLTGPLLSWRLARGKEDPERIAERRGAPGRARPDGALVWLHGASVGEAFSLLPLVERLTRAGRNVLITTGTVTSAALLARRLPPGAFHQFVPLDAPQFMRRFFAHWRPDVVLIAESELWPNLIVEAARAGAADRHGQRAHERAFVPALAPAAAASSARCCVASRSCSPRAKATANASPRSARRRPASSAI